MESGWVRKSRNGVTVVFVHGVLGTERTWQHSNGSAWPLLLAEETELDDYGIYLFNYRADAFSGTFSIQDAVDNLKERFNLDGVFLQTGIVFVCHSMGGIVARHLVVTQQARLIRAKTKIGLFLVASPSLGSDYANFVSTIALLYNSQLDTLRVGQQNAWLSTLDRTFIDLKEGGDIPIFGKELIEDNSIALKKFLRRQQIVQPFSGARYFGDSVKIEGSDHLSIAKPSDKSSIQHRLLVKFLLDFFEASGTSDLKGRSEAHSKNPILVSWPEAQSALPPGNHPRVIRISLLLGVVFAVAGTAYFAYTPLKNFASKFFANEVGDDLTALIREYYMPGGVTIVARREILNACLASFGHSPPRIQVFLADAASRGIRLQVIQCARARDPAFPS